MERGQVEGKERKIGTPATLLLYTGAIIIYHADIVGYFCFVLVFFYDQKEEERGFSALALHRKKKSLQHLLFPGGHPSKYWVGPTLLNFGDRTRTGVFSVVWP